MKIQDSTVLITGANRGLGARLVTRVLDAGAAKVYVAARDPETISADITNDPRIQTVALDITNDASVERAVQIAGDVNILINNAGVLAFGDVLNGDLELFARDMETNYFGTLRITRAFAPVLAARAPSAVANVLTLIALAPMGPMAGYCASKAAAHSMTQALRSSLRPMGIEVIGAYPGGIDTDMLAAVDADKARPEVVADRIVAAIESGVSMVWPDDAAARAGAVYETDPWQLEILLAG